MFSWINPGTGVQSSSGPKKNGKMVKFDLEECSLTVDEICELKVGENVDFRENNGKYRCYCVFSSMNAQMGKDGDNNVTVLGIERYHQTNGKRIVKNIVITDDCDDIFFKGNTMSNGKLYNANCRLANVRVGDQVLVSILPTKMKQSRGTVKKRDGGQLQVEYEKGLLYWVHCEDDEEICEIKVSKKKKNSNSNSKGKGHRKDVGGDTMMTIDSNNENDSYLASDTSLEWQMQQWQISNNGNNHSNHCNHSNHRSQLQSQAMVNGQKQLQQEKVVRTQLLIDATNDELGLIETYINKLIQYNELSNEENNNNRRKMGQLKKERSDANDVAVTGLMPFAMQCRGMRSAAKKYNQNNGNKGNLDFTDSYKLSNGIIDQFINAMAKKYNNDAYYMNRIKTLTNCMKLSLQGKKLPNIPLFDAKFDESVASDTLSRVILHSNHTVNDEIDKIENNYQEYEAQQAKMLKNMNVDGMNTLDDMKMNETERPSGDDLLMDSDTKRGEVITQQAMQAGFEQDMHHILYPQYPDV